MAGTGSPNLVLKPGEVPVIINQVGFLLYGVGAIKIPIPSPQELLVVLESVIAQIMPQLREICNRTYSEFFPNFSRSTHIKASTKCVYISVTTKESFKERGVVLTRNGAIFLQEWFLQQSASENPPWSIMLEEKNLILAKLDKTEWLQVVKATVDGIRKILADHARNLRERAKETDHIADVACHIEKNLNQVSIS
jgi:hypothetical protein